MRVVALFAVCILILAGVFEGVNGARVAGQGELGVCSRVLSAQWPSGEIFRLESSELGSIPSQSCRYSNPSSSCFKLITLIAVPILSAPKARFILRIRVSANIVRRQLIYSGTLFANTKNKLKNLYFRWRTYGGQCSRTMFAYSRTSEQKVWTRLKNHRLHA